MINNDDNKISQLPENNNDRNGINSEFFIVKAEENGVTVIGLTQR